MELFKEIKIDWLGRRRLFFVITMAMIAIGMISLVAKGGFRYGVDFKGGTIAYVRFTDPVQMDTVRELLREAGIPNSTPEALLNTGFNDILIEFEQADPNADVSAAGDQVRAALNKGYNGKFELLNVESVGAKVGSDLQRQAVLATLYALAGILVYIAFRFEWVYGAAAVFAVFHDTIITLGLFSLFGKEINLTVIAALLTLVGYSVNDTIVVFDRVRENLKTRRRDDFETILNDSINQTLSRTVIASGLTFLTVLALYLFGGEVINNFAFAMVIGIVVGTYSSIAVAAPLVLLYTKIRGQFVTQTATPKQAVGKVSRPIKAVKVK
jgi:preprotein translocase subunit SecF